jgi:putative membrane protein
MLDATLAWLHFLAIFGFTACLFAEAAFYARSLPPQTLRRLSSIDAAYGILALAVIVTGVAHLIFSPKTPAFYLHDAIFWTKIGLFLAVGLISIVPTVHLLRLRGASAQYSLPVEIEDRTYRSMRLCLTCELVLLAFIPLCAAFMARGYGYL